MKTVAFMARLLLAAFTFCAFFMCTKEPGPRPDPGDSPNNSSNTTQAIEGTYHALGFPCAPANDVLLRLLPKEEESGKHDYVVDIIMDDQPGTKVFGYQDQNRFTIEEQTIHLKDGHAKLSGSFKVSDNALQGVLRIQRHDQLTTCSGEFARIY